MAILDFAEVRIKSGREFLKEYDYPNAGHAQSRLECSKYIESTSGAKFSIHVTLHPNFNLQGGNGIKLTKRFDGQHGNARKSLLPEGSLQMRKGTKRVTKKEDVFKVSSTTISIPPKTSGTL